MNENQKKRHTDHSDRRILNEGSLGEVEIVRLDDLHALLHQQVDDTDVIEIRIAQILVDVGECHAVELTVRQTLCDLRLEKFFVLSILVVRIAQIFRYRLIVGLGQKPENGRFLFGLHVV